MNLQSGDAEASGSQANHHPHHQHHNHGHHHHHHHQQHRARLEEHDYIGMSEQQVFSNATTPKSTSGSANNMELNMRRTELQLGLPGSPVEDEDTGPFSAAMQLKKSPRLNGGLVKNSPTNNNTTSTTTNTTPNLLDDKDKDTKDGANARARGGGGVGSSSSSSSCHLIKQQPRTTVVDETPDCVEKQETRAPVGWPPVQSFRKNSLNTPTNNNNNSNNNSNNNNTNTNSDKVAENTAHPGPSNPGATIAPAGTSAPPTQPTTASQLVKVYMDGVPIGRKVNLRTHSSYDKLSSALEEMFKRFISGQSGTNKAMKEKVASECKKFNFIYGSDYVLTYEDKDGDLMLVGDVPWVMFVGTVKRLRIMKGSEAIGLAPRDQQPSAAPAPNAK